MCIVKLIEELLQLLLKNVRTSQTSIISGSVVLFNIRTSWLLNVAFNTNVIHFSMCYRSSHQRCSINKGVLRNFTKFAGKHLCQSFFFNKVAGRPATLLKKRLWHKCFPVNFAKFLRTPFYRTPFYRTPPKDCFWC